MPAVVIGLIAAVTATCLWAAYREVEATLVRAAVKDLTAQERDRLLSSAAAIVLKRDGRAATLLEALRQLLSLESPSGA